MQALQINRIQDIAFLAIQTVLDECNYSREIVTQFDGLEILLEEYRDKVVVESVRVAVD